MDYFKLFLFILHVYLETTLFPLLLPSYLNNTSVFYCLLLISSFFAVFALRKYNRFLTFIFVLADLLLALLLIQKFYHTQLIISDFAHVFFLFGLILLAFLFGSDVNSIKQVKQSSFLLNIMIAISTVISSYLIFYHFKNYHLKFATKIDSVDTLIWNKNKFLEEFAIDFLVFFNFYTIVNLIKHFYSKSKKKIFLRNIVSRFIMLVVITAAFYANYNEALIEEVYAKVNEHVPQPYNVVLYNSLALNADVRFRLFVTFLLYFVD